METTFAQSLAAFVSACLGAVLAISIGVSHRQLCALISFAAGSLLSAALFHILPGTWGLIPAWEFFIALGSGYLSFYLINRFVFHLCPACAASHFEHQNVSKFQNIFFLLAIALTIHSAMDGVAIALGEELGSSTGHSIFFTIAIHKLPEGLALCALLLRAGYEKPKAFLWTFFMEVSTLLGWFLGWRYKEFLETNVWINFLLLHISGGFIFLALHATLNEVKEHSPRFVLLFFCIGVLFMALVR